MKRRDALILMAATPALAARAQSSPTSEGSLQALVEQRAGAQDLTPDTALAAARIDGMKIELGARACGPDSLFEIGSITKTFTALLLADAVVRGKLKLEDPVEQVLPQSIKLRDSKDQPLRWLDLATQRSGLPRLPSNMAPRTPANPYVDYDDEALLSFLKDWHPTRERQAVYEYSNLGFGLMGRALAWKAGKPYATLLEERVLKPLALDEVMLVPSGSRRLVDGHDAKGKVVPHWGFTEAIAAAGALLATPRGLARYAQAAVGAFEHPLKEAFALCLQRRADGAAPKNPIGLAWNLAPLDQRWIYGHDGGTFGFSSSLWLDVDRARASLALCAAFVPVTDLGLHLIDSRIPLQDFSSTKQAAVTVDAEQLAALDGTYAMNPQFKITISARGARLFAQATGQGEFELFAKGPREFFARVTPLPIKFDGDTGPTPGLTVLQGGQHLRFVKE
ncbi:serine hydrolase [Paucibacter sp. R3-3]|uniref:Serine hydrolase n=1 Tax=Roseateles agri TaxID=3098619 RepID=A0ABU5DEL9_9BURK|nr:serine hydrolase [Paucibacter sp. R3-3]MDY0744213.1 serine hydrolase [Paucibacter sp. R3-3]